MSCILTKLSHIKWLLMVFGRSGDGEKQFHQGHFLLTSSLILYDNLSPVVLENNIAREPIGEKQRTVHEKYS